MRISDWSSDVCSSDLGGEAIFQDLDFRRYRENVPSVAITANPVVNFDPPSDQPQQAIIGETQWGAVYLQDQVSMLEGGRLKIGRASCRERVGRYVLLSGVAVALKKKKTTKIQH